jgi:predicted Zn-dependent protease
MKSKAMAPSRQQYIEKAQKQDKMNRLAESYHEKVINNLAGYNKEEQIHVLSFMYDNLPRRIADLLRNKK